MAIVPDTKNWTWVLERACPECRFDASSFAKEDVAALLRDNIASWPELLAASTSRTRPDSSTWSATEYACHVRDVFDLYERRLTLMLTEDDAKFENWDQDVTAIEKRYDEQDPAVVLAELTASGEVLAEHFETVSGDQWVRTGARSDGALFTVETFARYLVHDPVHHVWDVKRFS